MKKDRATAHAWEAEGLPLVAALYGMIQCILGRLVRDKSLPALDPIGSLNYFTPAIQSYRARAEQYLIHQITWDQLLARALGHLADFGWQDPGFRFPDQKLEYQKYLAEKRWQKKISHRARKWGVTVAEAEARMIERAANRKPRQLRLPRRAQRARHLARIDARLFPRG